MYAIRSYYANDQLVLNTETSMAKISQVDTHVYTAWKDGRFVFRNEPLESLLKTVARWYDVQIKIEDESLKEIHFTGDLPRYRNMNSLLKILQTVITSYSIHYTKLYESPYSWKS